MKVRVAPAVALVLSFGVAATGAARAQAPEAAFTTVEVLSVPTSQTLLGVSFPDPQHGYAVGGSGVIVATADGGATWTQQKSGVEKPVGAEEPTDSLRGVSFNDRLHGWAVGDANLILSTSDGGATWVRHDPPPITDQQGPEASDGSGKYSQWGFQDVQFTDDSSGHVVGIGGAILATTDGGRTWVWQGDRRYGTLRKVSFPDPQHGRAVGEGRPSSFVMIATADGGATWTIDPGGDAGPQVARSNFQAVSFTDPLRGHVASDSGRIFATTDGGAHWSVQRKDTTETFSGIAFSDARRGAAVGYTDFSNGRKAALVTTGDGGETWVPRQLSGAILWDVAFATPTTAYAVGCEVFTTTCQKSMVVRITFPGDAGPRRGGGGFAIPIPFLIGGAVLVAGLAGVLVVRRQPRSRKH